MKLSLSVPAISAVAALAVFSLTAPFPSASAADAPPPIDPVRGRALMQKANNGETLTAEEQAYLDRVKQTIRERAAGSFSRASGLKPCRCQNDFQPHR